MSDVIDEEDVLHVMADDDDPLEEEGEMSKHVVGELKPHEVEEKREVCTNVIFILVQQL